MTTRAPAGGAVVVLLLAFVPWVLGAGSAPDGPGLVVEPDRVEPGARDVTLTFRLTDGAVPVTGLELRLPTGRPLVGVTAQAPPGWAVDLTTTALPAPAPSADGPVTEIVSTVAWTASQPRAAGAVDFTVHADLLPEGAGPVRFRAACTDAAGNRVEWTDSWAEGGSKPAHDALKLALGVPRPAAAQTHGDHHGDHGAPVAAPATVASPSGVAATAGGALAAAAALVVLLRALARRQRRHLDRG